MKSELKKILEKQHYSIVGNHSGVKLCHWMKQSLIHGRECYKQSFYGIESHRCLQMTPTVNHCNHLCLFCWRHQDFNEKEIKNIDEPKLILEKCILSQRKLITGFKGDARCDIKRWKEANDPNMIACSLSGEPTLYPRLSEFFEECHKKNMITFLVTNGTNPEFLEKMDTLPKQLYVSLVAPNEKVYKKICSPIISNGWEKIKQTIELLPSLNTRAVIRHTLIKNWNMKKDFIKEFSKLDELGSPMFIEPKGYVFVGGSRKRMNLENMPSHDEVKNFGKILTNYLGYDIIMEKKDSRVVLLSKSKNAERIVK